MRNIKVIILISFTIFLLTAFIGCNNSGSVDNTILGGDIIRYSYCIVNDNSHVASIPLVSKYKIDSIEFISAEIDNSGDDVFTVKKESFDNTEYYKYKNYFIYFMVINVGCMPSDDFVSANIKNLKLKVNGQEVTYKTPHFKVCNGINSREEYIYNDQTILFGGTGSNTLLYSSLPSTERPASMGIAANSDVTLTSFYALDYLGINDFKINGNSYDNSNIDLDVTSGSEIEFNYSLNFSENCDDTNIIRVARILTFIDNGVKKAFVDGAVIYYYNGFQEQLAIKKYIDNL